MIRRAVFDKTGKYRYTLDRQWATSGPHIAWVLLNPSTADEHKDDPTIRRCINFSKDWGYGSARIVNIFAFRATKPTDLFAASRPVGPANSRSIKAAAARADIVILAWGVHGSYIDRGRAVLNLLDDFNLQCLGVTKDGHPKHPLYLSGKTRPRPFGCSA